VRLGARKNSKPLPRREQLMSEHMRAGPLRELLPEIEQLRIQLVFSNPNTQLAQPSSQLRTLFPAAPAFFRFSCPCADCDGDFDLTGAVTSLITSLAGRKRVASLTGQLSCQGVLFRDRARLQVPCPMQLSFQLLSEPHRTD
jgi:hypothetical protein